ncbi:MAG TPA: type II toxin-antitoxin system RelE/ParE family toxin [Companilactobacillus farciminis]|uniref:Type II toxin-antitoxin system RelE/ParE family toxin n=1 Tax=Companilactobacillus farciminis TaxID=1612 RepID=A0A921HQ91_9LACO|nr:type II toxin-antitoxin system RelE/ParE family toxin [Companilactobacillus farciminis]
MKILFGNKKIERICTQNDFALRKFGLDMSEKIEQRISELMSFETVNQLIYFSVGRCHPLQGKRKGQYAMDLVHPYRLIFVKKESKVEIVQIIEIVDYH